MRVGFFVWSPPYCLVFAATAAIPFAGAEYKMAVEGVSADIADTV